MIKNKFRSKLEKNFYTQFKKNITGYETNTIEYAITHRYTPDFEIAKNTYIETKGIFDSADRTKIKNVLAQNPGVMIIMVFQKPHMTISKASKTTYANWCEKNDIPWFDVNDTKGIERMINAIL